MPKELRVTDYLEQSCVVDLAATNKIDALKELISILASSHRLDDPKTFEDAIFERENLMSTGIGYEIAVPHARHDGINDFIIAIGRSKSGIEYESIDNQPVKLVFMIGANTNQQKDYVRLLARLVLRLKNKQFVQSLLIAQSTAEIYRLIAETE